MWKWLHVVRTGLPPTKARYCSMVSFGGVDTGKSILRRKEKKKRKKKDVIFSSLPFPSPQKVKSHNAKEKEKEEEWKRREMSRMD